MIQRIPRLKRVLACLCVVAPFAGFAQAANAGQATPRILVSVAPLQPLVDALLDGIGHSELLARPGQDAHTMALSPSQARAIAHADIIVMPDRAMNPIVATLATKNTKQGAVIVALTELDGAEPLPYAQQQPWLEEDDDHTTHDVHGDDHDHHAHHHAHDAAIHDPHLWLDPLRMAALAAPLAQAIAAHAPSHRARLLANAETLRLHLTQRVHPALAAIMANRTAKKHMDKRPFIPFISSHSAYQYFLARYGIDDAGALLSRPEDVLGARSGHAVLQQSGRVRIGCIIAEQESAMVRRVASASGASIIRLSPENFVERSTVPALPWITNDYDRLLAATATAIGDCLEK